ncbi:MAG: F0F1 ATP synthase subunit epsilon [Candidatus Coatesbacteria bacterium]|nr:F0F1 ATP synthase subunit epsilon [Candidatus Coatesbacteria bacterium]
MQEQTEKLSLAIVTPTEQLVFEQVDELRVPGTEGDFEVFPEHTPFLTSLRPGVLSYRIGAKIQYFAVSGGFVEVIPDRVIILAQTAESSDSISVDRAKKAKERAKRRLESANKGDREIDVERAETALLRAVARLSACTLAGKKF